MTYSYDLRSGDIVRDLDGKVVSPCLSDQDPDFLEYCAWGNAGNSPRQIQPSISVDELVQAYTVAIQSHLDTTVKARNYDGILSLCSYATSKNPRFSVEGQAGVEWRDAVWAYAYAYLAEVMGGTRDILTVEDLLAELPVLNWE